MQVSSAHYVATDGGEEQLAVCCGRGRLTREEQICNSCRDPDVHSRFECETCGEETCEVAERKLGGCVACQTPAVLADLSAFERMRAMAADGGGLGAALDAWRCNALVRAVQVRGERQTQLKRKREAEEQVGASSSADAAAEDSDKPPVPSFEPGSQQESRFLQSCVEAAFQEAGDEDEPLDAETLSLRLREQHPEWMSTAFPQDELFLRALVCFETWNVVMVRCKPGCLVKDVDARARMLMFTSSDSSILHDLDRV